jgi:hypothetical protein
VISGENVAKSNLKQEPNGKSRPQAASPWIYARRVILVLLTVGVFSGLAYVILHEKPTKAPPGTAAAVKESGAGPAATTKFAPVKGRWVRPDGGYVLDIREVGARGKMAAAYFNPRPINVSRAEAAMAGATIKVFVELRDINYPGATYNLTYDPGSDQLKGIYFQPLLQQSFEVFFVRLK